MSSIQVVMRSLESAQTSLLFTPSNLVVKCAPKGWTLFCCFTICSALLDGMVVMVVDCFMSLFSILIERLIGFVVH
jgi:hypothetical protein